MGIGSLIGGLFGKAGGGIVESIGNVADKFITTKEEKAEFNLKMEKIVSGRLSELEETARAELKAKENIIVAELAQDDKYSKRSRPTIIYAGLFFIFLNHVLFPVIGMYTGKTLDNLVLPDAFWYSWTGICSAYAVGKSFEKSGVKNKATSLITGNKKSLFD